jgi:type IV pilus assembly protein PilE
MSQSQRQWGFTLVELMIVVVIVAILASIAYPSYQRYVLRSHRAEGQALLGEAAARQERFYTQNNSFASTAAALNMTSYIANLQYYNFVISNVTATSYTLTATTKSSQTADSECLSLTLDQAGTRSNTGTGIGTTCWK